LGIEVEFVGGECAVDEQTAQEAEFGILDFGAGMCRQDGFEKKVVFERVAAVF
jgi:hypothetical protein